MVDFLQFIAVITAPPPFTFPVIIEIRLAPSPKAVAALSDGYGTTVRYGMTLSI